MMKKTISKVGILCVYAFPEGMAAATRILSYGKGLVDNGVRTEIYSFHMQPNDGPYPLEGEINGIYYLIPHTWDVNKSKYRKWLVDRYLVRIKALIRLLQSHKIQKFDYVLCSFDKLTWLFFYVPLLRLFGIKVIFIGDEYPGAIRNLKPKVPLNQIWGYKMIYKFISGRILMTNALKDYYNKNVSVKPTHILCSILNIDRFKNLTRKHVERPYLCYMGNLRLKKDNVDNIIRAFELVKDEFPELELNLYGNPLKEDALFLKRIVEQTNLQGRVNFKGRVNFDQVPQILANATILVTSQPITKRAEGGFPTKMGEYMMSHTPMIVTDVGEISQYIDNKINGMIVPPCKPEEYAGAIRFLINNPKESKEIAEKAYQYAVQSFNAKDVVKGMIDFLNNLN